MGGLPRSRLQARIRCDPLVTTAAKIENIRQRILDVHRERPIGSPTREPLVMCKTWAPPHANDPKAAGVVEGDWQDQCIDGEPDKKSPKDASWPPKKPATCSPSCAPPRPAYGSTIKSRRFMIVRPPSG